MKKNILNLFQGEKGVIRIFIGFLLCFNFGNSQEFNPIPHYKLMETFIAQDTIVPDWRKSVLKMEVENGEITPKDTIRYINKIRTRRLILKSKSENEYFKKLLLEMSDKGNQLARDIGLNFELKMLNQIPLGYTFEDHENLKGIELIDNPSSQDRYHSFSTPLEIDKGVYLIFWMNKGKGSLNATFQFVKYTIKKDGEVKIIRYYLYGIS